MRERLRPSVWQTFAIPVKTPQTVRMGGIVTLSSLAAELGVHVSTVSRALSDLPTGVSPAQAERIRQLAQERGYRRNLAARALRTGRSQVVAMTVPRLTDMALAAVYQGADEASIEAGYTSLVANTLDRPDLRRRRVDLLLARQVEGLLVADSQDDPSLLDHLVDVGLPHVLTLRRLPGRLSVSTDDLLGGRLVAEHILSLGHRRVGIVAGNTRASTGRERTAGFLAAYEEAGIEVPDRVVVACSFDVKGGVEATRRVLAADPHLTALFVVSDNVAVGAMSVLRESGRSVPDDVAVAGYNDLDLAAALPVPLTSVDSRLVEVGRRAMGTLLELIGGGTPESQLIEPRLIVRASTAHSQA